jgi:TonB family protein
VKHDALFSLALHAGLLLALVLVSTFHFSATRYAPPFPARVRLLNIPAVEEAAVSTAPAPARTAPDPAAARKKAPGLKITADQTGVPSYYLGQVVGKIGQNWRNPFTSGQLTLRAVVRFTIGPSGGVASIAVESSSGNALFDQAALRAVYQAKQFPPLPGDLGSGPLTVHFEFEFAPEKAD